MADSLSEYSENEFKKARILQTVKMASPTSLRLLEHPRAVLLGGQSGAGKTTLHKIYQQTFAENVIVISGDDYRRLHPRYREIDELYGIDSPSHTASWAGAMTEALIDDCSLAGFNLVIEGTLRTAEVPLKTARLLRERGYSVDLALMGVKPEISLVSCKIHYELMRLAGTIPRATDPEHHWKIVREIVGNLATLEQSGLFDRISIFSRSRECLYPVPGSDKSASETLDAILFGPWTLEERNHYRYLENKLAELEGSPLE